MKGSSTQRSLVAGGDGGADELDSQGAGAGHVVAAMTNICWSAVGRQTMLDVSV